MSTLSISNICNEQIVPYCGPIPKNGEMCEICREDEKDYLTLIKTLCCKDLSHRNVERIYHSNCLKLWASRFANSFPCSYCKTMISYFHAQPQPAPEQKTKPEVLLTKIIKTSRKIFTPILYTASTLSVGIISYSLIGTMMIKSGLADPSWNELHDKVNQQIANGLCSCYLKWICFCPE